MAPPAWVTNLDDYWWWCEQQIDWSTGLLVSNSYLIVERYPDADDPSKVAMLIVPSQRLLFANGSHLTFEFQVNADLELPDYHFHYSRPGGECVWRYDKHPGHEEEDGTDIHVHHGPNENREAGNGPVDIADVLYVISADQAVTKA